MHISDYSFLFIYGMTKHFNISGFLSQLHLHTFYRIFFPVEYIEEGGGASPIPCLSSFAIGKKDTVKLNIPSNFPFQYFLLSSCLSCFYTLRPLHIPLLTSSCGADRRDIKRCVGGRVGGITS